MKPLCQDPPDAPIQESCSVLFGSIVSKLKELTPKELFLLKEAVVDEQVIRESKMVLEGAGIME